MSAHGAVDVSAQEPSQLAPDISVVVPRPARLAMTLMMVGAQTGFAAFFLVLFRIDRSR